MRVLDNAWILMQKLTKRKNPNIYVFFKNFVIYQYMYAMQYDYMSISRHLSIRIALNSSVIFTFLPHHRDINFKHSICVACREYKYNAFYWQFDTFRMMDLQDITTGTSLFYHNQAIFLVGNEWCANENWNIKILINFGQKCYNLSKRIRR